jgi:hypothetical protein
LTVLLVTLEAPSGHIKMRESGYCDRPLYDPSFAAVAQIVREWAHVQNDDSTTNCEGKSDECI